MGARLSRFASQLPHLPACDLAVYPCLICNMGMLGSLLNRIMIAHKLIHPTRVAPHVIHQNS